jgi:hypothetical protein
MYNFKAINFFEGLTMQQKLTEITNKTMIPLSFVIVIWYSINFIVNIKSQTEVNAKDITTITALNDKIGLQLSENTKALIRIEILLKNLERRLNND